MWSEKHWKAMERSFELMGQAGCKAIYVSLVRRTDFGNRHGMVRWIRKGEGWQPDLSVAEKYVATCLSLPMYPELTTEQIESVATEIKALMADTSATTSRTRLQPAI